MDSPHRNSSTHRALGRLLLPVGKSRSHGTAKPQKIGLETLNPRISSPTANIIFIHGLGGNRELTWCHERNPEYFWPKKWLPTDSDLASCQIHTFGYDADWATFKDTTTSIVDFAKRLNLELFTLGVDSAPVIFVAHSLGGLVAKKVRFFSYQHLG